MADSRAAVWTTVLFMQLALFIYCDISHGQNVHNDNLVGNLRIRPTNRENHARFFDNTFHATDSTRTHWTSHNSSSSSTTPPAVDVDNQTSLEPDSDLSRIPVDLFPEFLPMDNDTSPQPPAEVDLTVGSGDGEILDVTTVVTSTVAHFSATPVVGVESEPQTTSTQVPLDPTTASSMDTLHANNSITRGPLGMIKFRESRILEGTNQNETSFTQDPKSGIERVTWSAIPLLPAERNTDDPNIAPDNSGNGTHEGLTPFTIPHHDLSKFLFSTLITENSIATTAMNSPEVTTTSTSSPPDVSSPSPSTTFTTRKTTGTKRYSFAGWKTTPLSSWVTFPRQELVTEAQVELATTDEAVSESDVPPSTLPPTTNPVFVISNTTFPRPMLFWSDGPGLPEQKQVLFEDDESVGSMLLTPVTYCDDPHFLVRLKCSSFKGTIDTSQVQNLSRSVLENVITVLMKYVGQQDFVFSDTNKKTMAELILWPITHQVGNTSSSQRQQSIRDSATTDPLTTNVNLTSSWPVLKFIRPTPALVDGVWVVTFYITQKDSNASIIPRARVLSLCHDAQIKLMTKMSIQLVRIIHGFPVVPFNGTDFGRDTPTEYRPLFERFSSLFIPLIVLAAICAFVAVITVVCLVKKAQNSVRMDHHSEKMLRPGELLGVHNPMSDEIIKSGERPSSNSTIPAGSIISAKEMYETEGWVVPMDPNCYPPMKRVASEEDTKL